MERRNRRIYLSVFALLFVFSFVAAVSVAFAEPANTGLERGKVLYERYCAFCHGKTGEGNGPAGHVLFPKPRDFTMGLFKVRTTSSGQPPTDSDIMNIIKYGMPGSSMPSFIELKEGDVMAVVKYVKKLADITKEPKGTIQTGTPPAVTPQLLALGKEVYEKKAQCWKCHGMEGRGDGPSAATLKDSWGQVAPPNPFKRNIYKGGGSPQDIYLRFTTGMDGSPMPAYEESLTDEERWAVIFYNYTLAGMDGVKVPFPSKRSENKPSVLLK
ncbi:MAG: c-type cytochrome [Nitrospirae bacterium]|nr:c-type cytochrome [Nitrospirota bacterium]